LEGNEVDLNKILGKLTTSDKVIGASTILLFIFLFFPWFSKGGGSHNGWHYLLFGFLPFLLALVMVAQIVITRFTETKLPDLPISWAQVHLIAGGLAALLVLLKLLIGDKISYGIVGVASGSITLDRSIGLFLSLLATLGLAAGGFLKTREPADAGETGTAPPTGA
jgi:hypothetical protein